MVDALKPHWYRLTPDHCAVALLVVECLLWLSERFQWLALNAQRGSTVLIAVVAVGAMIVSTLLWLIVAILLHWRFQFGIRSLLLLAVAVALPSSWLAVEMNMARQQKEAVAIILKLGGSADYDYVLSSPLSEAKPRGPAWLRSLLADDFFNSVVEASLNTDAQMAHLNGLRRLHGLFLSGQTITDAGLASLAELNELQSLSLAHTAITDAGMAGLARLNRLQVLSFTDTVVTDTGLAHLAALTRLQELSLDGTNVTDAGLAHLSGLTRLQRLFLNGTKITDAGLAHLSGLDQLEVLRLTHTTVTDTGLSHLAGLTKLQQLHLDGTQVTDAGLAHLTRLSQLRRLSLNSTRVTDAGLAHLAALNQLQELWLTCTRVTDNGVINLKQSLPNCEMVNHGWLLPETRTTPPPRPPGR
jgi:hypothetical protein